MAAGGASLTEAALPPIAGFAAFAMFGNSAPVAEASGVAGGRAGGGDVDFGAVPERLPGSAGGRGKGPEPAVRGPPVGMPGNGGGPPASGARNDSGDRASPKDERLNGSELRVGGVDPGGGGESFADFAGIGSSAGGIFSDVPVALAFPDASRAPVPAARSLSLRPFLELLRFGSPSLGSPDLESALVVCGRFRPSAASLLIFDWSCAIERLISRTQVARVPHDQLRACSHVSESRISRNPGVLGESSPQRIITSPVFRMTGLEALWGETKIGCTARAPKATNIHDLSNC